MSHKQAVCIEAEDTLVTNSTPSNTIIALTQRGYVVAYIAFLAREAPRCELNLIARNNEQSLVPTTYPNVPLPVFKHSLDGAGVHMNARHIKLISLYFA